MLPVPHTAIFCNPILDFIADVDDEWMAKYSLQHGGYTMYDKQVQSDIYENIQDMKSVSTVPGGAGQNCARICAELCNKPNEVVYFGCVGGKDKEFDSFAKTMLADSEKSGVRCEYEISAKGSPTGTCAVCVHHKSRDRSMCTNLGATADFTCDFVKGRWNLVESARIVHFTGFFVTASPDTIRMLCEKVGPKATQILFSSLSANFIIEFHQEQVLLWLRYSQVVAGNDDEWRKLGEVFGSRFGIGQPSSLQDILGSVCASEDYLGHPEKPRILIATCGSGSTIVASKMKKDDKVRLDSFVVRHVPNELIVDTNGCGDGFNGGVIYQMLRVANFAHFGNHDLANAIEQGHLCGREVLQHVGCQFTASALRQAKVEPRFEI